MARSGKSLSTPASIVVLAGFVGLLVWFFFFSDGTLDGSASSPAATAESGVPAPGGEAADAGSAPLEPGPWTSAGYVLQFSDTFNPGLTTVDDFGISVLIAVDVSGSMKEAPARGLPDPKYIQASRALSQILDFLETMTASPAMKGLVLKVGIISFYSELGEVAPLTVMDKKGFQTLRGILDNPANFEPGGRTAIGLALERGAEILSQSGTILKSLIIISDGENTEGIEPKDALAAINENRNNKSSRDLPVSTRGILTTFVGFDIDAGLFAPLAGIGSRISAAADQKELEQALQSVLVADITRLEKAGK